MRAAGRWALLTLRQAGLRAGDVPDIQELTGRVGFDLRALPVSKGRTWGRARWIHPVCVPPLDLNKACGNAMDAHEAAQMHQNFSQQLLQDHIEACSLPEHNLITV